MYYSPWLKPFETTFVEIAQNTNTAFARQQAGYFIAQRSLRQPRRTGSYLNMLTMALI